MISDDLRQRRLKIIKEHMDTEMAQEFDLTLATFNGHPHYEIVPTGQVFDGAEEVMGCYQASRAAFPDLRHGNVRCHVADDTVIVEFDLLGTNLGKLYGMPPMGNAFSVPTIAVFFFDDDRIVSERVYFDSVSLLTQIGRGDLLALIAGGQRSAPRSGRCGHRARYCRRGFRALPRPGLGAVIAMMLHGVAPGCCPVTTSISTRAAPRSDVRVVEVCVRRIPAGVLRRGEGLAVFT